MQRILFLDIDGVLNSAEWCRAGYMRDAWIDHFSPRLCERLERVLATTGCDIVVSSSWRITTPEKTIERYLRARGAPSAHVIGATPAWRQSMGRGNIVGAYEMRGDEIAAWLTANPAPSNGRVIAIVDDSDDMGPLSPRLVLTSWERGIEDSHAERLIKMLNRA